MLPFAGIAQNCDTTLIHNRLKEARMANKAFDYVRSIEFAAAAVRQSEACGDTLNWLKSLKILCDYKIEATNVYDTLLIRQGIDLAKAYRGGTPQQSILLISDFEHLDMFGKVNVSRPPQAIFKLIEQEEQKFIRENLQNTHAFSRLISAKFTWLDRNGKKKEGLVYLEQAIAAERAASTVDSAYLLNLYIQAGSTQLQLGLTAEARQTYSSALAFDYRLNADAPTRDSYRIWIDLGRYYRAVGEHDLALEFKLKARQILNRLPAEIQKSELSALLNSTAIDYKNLGLYNKALEIYNQALVATAPGSRPYADITTNIGIVYRNMGDPQKAIPYMLEGLTAVRKHEGESAATAFRYINIGTCYSDMELYEEAGRFLRQGTNLLMQKTSPYNPQLYIGYSYLLANAINQKQTDTVQVYFNAIDTLFAHSKSPLPITSLLEPVMIKAQYAETLGDYEKQAQLATEGLALLESEKIEGNVLGMKHKLIGLLGFAKSMLKQPNEADSLFRVALALSEADEKSLKEHFTITKLATTLQLNLYKKNADANLLRKALEIYERGRDTVLLRLARLGAYTDYQFFATVAASLGWGLDTYFEGGRAFRQPEKHRQAFEDLERFRNLQIRAALQTDQAMHLTGIPDTMHHRRRELERLINYYEAKQFSEGGANAALADSTRLRYTNEVFKLRQDLSGLQEQLEQQYPDYRFLKNALTTASSAQVQSNLLQPGQCLVEYYYGEKPYEPAFVFVLTRDTFAMISLGNSSGIDSLCSAFHGALAALEQANQLPEPAYRQRLQQYLATGRALYNRLVAPVRGLLTEEMLIVPFKTLSLVPFEALLTEDPVNLARPHTFPYLLRQHTISYTESASLLLELRNRPARPEPEGLFLGFAPYYDGDTTALASVAAATRKDLKPLQHTGEEVYRLQNLMGGKVYLGQDATEAQLREQAPRHRIIHLATHGQANRQLGDYSFLAFAEIKDSIENELLYAKEIYPLRLNADLVVLSACETGLGKLQYSEGLQGLTRALTLAGARSIVASLWNVNDRHTKELMLLFYKEVKKGQNLNVALTKAKRNYLDKYRDAALPFFWAGFTLNGEYSRIR